MTPVKTANVNVRIEADIKTQAEKILEAIGITQSAAIDMFYRQIILNRGIPFELKLPGVVNSINEIPSEMLDKGLVQSYEKAQAGNTISLDEAFENLV